MLICVCVLKRFWVCVGEGGGSVRKVCVCCEEGVRVCVQEGVCVCVCVLEGVCVCVRSRERGA